MWDGMHRDTRGKNSRWGGGLAVGQIGGSVSQLNQVRMALADHWLQIVNSIYCCKLLKFDFFLKLWFMCLCAYAEVHICQDVCRPKATFRSPFSLSTLWKQGILSSLHIPGWLAGEFPGNAPVSTSHLTIRVPELKTPSTSWLLMWFLGIKLRSSDLHSWAFYLLWAIPRPVCLFL